MSGSDPVLGRGFIPLEDTVHHIDSKHSVSEPLNEATHRVPEPDISSEIVPAQEGSKSLQMRNSHVSYEIPDGGWGWVMVGSAFFCSLIYLGIHLSFGIMFSQKLTQMGLSSSTTSWIFNLYNFMFNLSAVFGTTLCDAFSWRSVGFSCGLVSGLTFTLMIFVEGPGLMFLLFSIILGISAGIGSVIGFLTFPFYFESQRGRAAAIVLTGVSIGQIFLPIFLKFLLEEYGFAGTCLIFGGIVLHCCVASLLLYNVNDRPLVFGDTMKSNANKELQIPMVKLSKSKSIESTKRISTTCDCTHSVLKILRQTYQQTKMVKHVRLLIVTLSFALVLTGMSNFIAIVPFAMAERGHSLSEASYCLSAGAIANTASRFFVSCFSDKKWFNRKLVYFCGSVVSAAASFATAFCLEEVRLVMACQVVWSAGIGANLCVYHNLIIDTCGRELYPAAVSISSLMLAAVNISIGPLIGIARDFSSYQVSIAMTGFIELSCTLLWLAMPLARLHDNNKFYCHNQELHQLATRSQHNIVKTS